MGAWALGCCSWESFRVSRERRALGSRTEAEKSNANPKESIVSGPIRSRHEATRAGRTVSIGRISSLYVVGSKTLPFDDSRKTSHATEKTRFSGMNHACSTRYSEQQVSKNRYRPFHLVHHCFHRRNARFFVVFPLSSPQSERSRASVSVSRGTPAPSSFVPSRGLDEERPSENSARERGAEKWILRTVPDRGCTARSRFPSRVRIPPLRSSAGGVSPSSLAETARRLLRPGTNILSARKGSISHIYPVDPTSPSSKSKSRSFPFSVRALGPRYLRAFYFQLFTRACCGDDSILLYATQFARKYRHDV